MRTLRLSLIGTVILVLLGGLGGVVSAQDEESLATEVVRETVFELTIPSDALPEDFVKLVVEHWKLAPGTDSTGSPASILANEGLRGRGIVVDAGTIRITPAADALFWRGLDSTLASSPAGEAVTLGVGDAIFLPAIPDAEVERDAPLVIANPGSEPATALSFHTHQQGGAFLGYPAGLSIDGWNMTAIVYPETAPSFDGADVVLRLSRLTGEPGATVPTSVPPALATYYVEAGALEQVISGPKGDYTWDWPAGGGGFNPRPEAPVTVAGDGPASVLELVAIPQPSTE